MRQSYNNEIVSKITRSGILRKFRTIFMQISCEFASDFFEKRLSHIINPAEKLRTNRRAASDEKPTPDLTMIEVILWIDSEAESVGTLTASPHHCILLLMGAW